MNKKLTVKDTKYLLMASLGLIASFLAGKLFKIRPLISSFLLITAFAAELYILIGKSKEFRELQDDVDESIRLLSKGLKKLDNEPKAGLTAAEERIPFAKEDARKLNQKNRESKYLRDYLNNKIQENRFIKKISSQDHW